MQNAVHIFHAWLVTTDSAARALQVSVQPLIIYESRRL